MLNSRKGQKENAQYMKNDEFLNCGKIVNYAKAMAPAK